MYFKFIFTLLIFSKINNLKFLNYFVNYYANFILALTDLSAYVDKWNLIPFPTCKTIYNDSKWISGEEVQKFKSSFVSNLLTFMSKNGHAVV